VGVKERWFERTLDQRIHLPGALQNQGFGDEVGVDTKWTGDVGADRWLNGAQYEKYRQQGKIKVPFFLQPERHYAGVAWYQREFEIPRSWQGKRVVLTFERVHWGSSVWVDGQVCSENLSLSTPHHYDLGTTLAPGKHTLTLRIDNDLLGRVNVGSWAHSVSDHTQGNWNGVIGAIELAATSPVWLEDVQIYPKLASKSAAVRAQIGNRTGQPGHGKLTLKLASAGAEQLEVPVGWDREGGRVEAELALPESVQMWDEFHPALQRVTVRLDGAQAADNRDINFGFREISVQGRDFVLNGRKLFLRGTLECCIFPLTGYPPTDEDSWKRVIRACQAHGLNHIRFHSWCPPEAAFAAADELGFYFSVEIAAWTSVGDGQPIDGWLYGEAARVLRAYGNHPSFLLMPYGNEPGGSNHAKWLGQWVNHWKAADPRRLYTSGSGWPEIAENQYHVTPAPRGPKGWLGRDYQGDVLKKRDRDRIMDSGVPVIVHEMGQWCVYPNFDEIKKYKGPLKAKNFEIFRDSLAEHGMLGQWRDFLRASGKLQALCYKEEVEAALRTQGIGGFQLLDLHDFPGQGTALVGVLDPFWDSKGYISPREFRRFCNTTVPLARVLKRVWTSDETFSSDVEVAHFGPVPLENVIVGWKWVTANGKLVASGELAPPQERGATKAQAREGRDGIAGLKIAIGQGIKLGRVQVDLAAVKVPSACKLVIGLKGTSFENDWNIWVYPPAKPDNETQAAPDVVVASALDSQTLAGLGRGGKVLLLPSRLSNQHPRLGFEPIFWNRYMFNTQGRQTLGLLCDARHPALAEFPTEFFQDWQWNEIVARGRGTVLDLLPCQLRPIVQVIDDWNTNRKLGLIWECRVGPGRLMVCSADLQQDLEKRPAARQLRASLLRYMAGPGFKPSVEVSPQDLTRLFESSSPSKLVQLGARVIEVDSEDSVNGNYGRNVSDGDPETIWHTKWTPANDPMPHHLIIDLGSEVSLKGMTYLPRQDMANGRIADAEVYCSTEPNAWGAPVVRTSWPNTDQLQTLVFKQPVRARYLKVVALSEVNGNPFAGIAELDVLADTQ
jgi:hypothetical protein